MNIVAAIAREPGAAFSLEQATLDAPRPDEIIVRIAGVGLCHSDLLARDGVIPVALPAVFGHEGSGEVVAVGEAVRKVKIGDRVVLSFDSCLVCPRCLVGDLAYCNSGAVLNYSGGRQDGTKAIHCKEEPVASHFFGQSSFANYAICTERNAVIISDDVPLEIMGPLGCGIQTGAGTVMNTMVCKPNSSLLISGGGSVGLSALLAAIVQGCNILIVIEPYSSRRRLAVELGATHVIDPNAEDVFATVRRIVPLGVDYAFDTTGLDRAVNTLMGCLGVRGTLVLAGVPPTQDTLAAFPMLPMVAMGQTVKGVVEGDSDPMVFIPKMIGLYQQGRFPFDRLITTYPLNAINEAVRDHKAGLCVKAVLLP